MQIELGTRVVRGVDWIWSDQDGEEGMLGTVIQLKSEATVSLSVKVLWDHGGQGIYRSGENNACDLSVFCSPAGKKSTTYILYYVIDFIYIKFSKDL